MSRSAPLILFVLLALFSGGRAVQAEATTTPQVTSETIATVNIGNAIITSQKDHSFVIDFDISNRIGVQPDVHYGVALVKTTNSTQEVVDEKVYDDVLTLGENVSVHKTITYQTPENFSGKFSLRLLSENSRSIPLAYAPLGMVTLQPSVSGSLSINLATCHAIISKESSNTNQKIGDLFSISTDESLAVLCTVKNSTKGEVKLNSSVSQHMRNAYGDLVTNVVTPMSVSIAAGQSKVVTVNIPNVTKPESYYVGVSFSDTNTNIETNKIFFRYYQSGVGASIRTLSLDKDGYKKGETATVSFMWSLVDSSFLNKNAVAAGVRPQVSAVVSLVNDKKIECAPQISQILSESNGIIKIPIVLSADCTNPEISLSLVDVNQKVLDTQTFSITTVVKPSPFNMYGIITLLGGIIALVLIYFLRKKTIAKAPIIVLFMVLSFFGGAKNVHADTVALWYICGAGYHQAPVCPAATGIFIQEGLDKTSYAQGETVTVRYFVYSDDNPQPESGINPNLRGTIDGSGVYGPDAASPGPYTVGQLTQGFFVSASAGGVVQSGTSGSVTTSLGSNGYGGKYGGPLPFTITPPSGTISVPATCTIPKDSNVCPSFDISYTGSALPVDNKISISVDGGLQANVSGPSGTWSWQWAAKDVNKTFRLHLGWGGTGTVLDGPKTVTAQCVSGTQFDANGNCRATSEVIGTCNMSKANDCTTGMLGSNTVQSNGDYHWYCDGIPNDAAHRSQLCWYTPPPSTASCTNGASNYPACDNICTNGYTNYPTCGPTYVPSCTNGDIDGATCCGNGYSNYPTCWATSCTNGASNYPACDNICTNGYTNYPTCGPASCSADYPYPETRPDAIASYCAATGVTCPAGQQYVSSISCHSGTNTSGQVDWSPYGNSCTAPHCTGCGCVPGSAIDPSLAPCTAVGLHTWGIGCSEYLNETVPSGTVVTDTNTADGYKGEEKYLCTNGDWGAPLSAFCTATPNTPVVTPGVTPVVTPTPSCVPGTPGCPPVCTGIAHTSQCSSAESNSCGQFGTGWESFDCNGNSQGCSAQKPIDPQVTATISVSPIRVKIGGTTTVSWTTSGANSCTITNNYGKTLGTFSNSSCNITRTPVTDTVTTQTSYSITCRNDTYHETASSNIVNVVPLYQEF